MADNIQLKTPDAGAPTVRTTADSNDKHHQHILLEYLNNSALQVVTDQQGLPVRQVPGDRAENSLEPAAVYMPQSTSAFGHLVAVKPKTEFALLFPYSVDTAPVIKFEIGSGSIASANSQAELSSGTTIGSYSAIASKDFLVYQPGFGAGCKFTFGCTTQESAGVDLTGSLQEAGIGTAEDGFFFSYRNNSMSIVHRYGGLRDVHILEVTVGSSSATNVTVTLNDVVITAAVSNNTGDANQTVLELANNNDWRSAGYIAHVAGNRLVLQAISTGPKAGAFSFAAGTSGMTATLTQDVVGVTETVDVVPQASWSEDSCDGTGLMPLLDWSKGQVFDIKYQWLGYGPIFFYIENPTTRSFQLVHKIDRQNSFTRPSVNNPSLQFLIFATNGALTQNVKAFTASVHGYIDGGEPASGNRRAASYSLSGVASAFEPVISFHNPLTFKNKTNRSQVDFLRLSLTASQAANFIIVKNADLEGTSSWSATSSDQLILTDTAADGYNNGEVVWADAVTSSGIVSTQIDSSLQYIVRLHPGDVVTLAAKSETGTVKVNVSANWIEPV
jgi:hypothetical protein